ncbi:vacuolar protein sorting-associated protein 33A [Nomia melanderi]|uniref:vacuolar protein sorting-associated protein 33A n=1 Tax=Nomia melanderi TaxID=2448451 RepID=UPI0013043B5E|nr:vacuolar protein sorting-associated protein 33A [Nomia melanderi]XP_031836622.1 vacuolar protein sorting-associated protein 33A [Nomia melanderi]XP_031836623.1 vacuolar protein sorting-associated protein 33A [Nomia melanderi]XP_031836624.1 vacuolar protein sorting-associated protein 33A [Nomia melanderi]
MSSAHLSTGRLNVGIIQEQARKQLLCLLEKCDGTKAIIWDQSLEGPIGLVAKYNLLEEHDVVKMYPLCGGKLSIPSNITNIIFISRPQLNLMDLIAENVHGEEGKRPRKEFHLFFVPRKSLLCQKKLQNRGVFGSFTLIEEFKCDLFPFDNDLLSMELSGAFKEFHLENDPTCLYQVAQAIHSLQGIYGKIPKVTGRGPAASKVWDLLERLNREEEDSKVISPQSSVIEHLLLFDRSVDLLSPLVTQLTYEGLIDEIFGIKYNTVQLPARRFHDSEDSPTAMSLNEMEQIILNSAEELFAEIKDKNFNGVGPVLSKKAKIILSQFDEKHGDKSVQEIKQFVARLPHMLATKQSLAKHTTIAQMIKEVTDSSSFLESLQVEQELLNCIDTDKPNAYIEDLIAQQQPLLKVLRLLCIQSLTNSGLKQKLLDYYKREIIQTYGYQHLPTILNLEKAGLLKQQQSTRQYAVLRKALRLTVEDESEIAPKDISYVHSIYAPLSIRLAEHLVQPTGWQGLNDVMGLLPGPTINSVPLNIASSGRRNSITSEDSNSEPPKLVMVFFIGGCTFAEISALRFLSQQEDLNVEFVVCTTKIINGDTFLTSLIENLDNT